VSEEEGAATKVAALGTTRSERRPGNVVKKRSFGFAALMVRWKYGWKTLPLVDHREVPDAEDVWLSSALTLPLNVGAPATLPDTNLVATLNKRHVDRYADDPAIAIRRGPRRALDTSQAPAAQKCSSQCRLRRIAI
jgi:hypothetical protein